MPPIITSNNSRTSKCPTSLTSMHGANSPLLSNRVSQSEWPRALHKNQELSLPVDNHQPRIRQVSNSMDSRGISKINKTDQKQPHMTTTVMIRMTRRLHRVKEVKTQASLNSRSKKNQRSSRRTYFPMKNQNQPDSRLRDLSSSSLIRQLSKLINCLTLMMTLTRSRRLRLTYFRTIRLILIRRCKRRLSITT